MKRVHLWQPGTGRQDINIVRSAAVALARYAVDDDRGRRTGDPVHDEVTEGRRAAYERAYAAGAAWARNMPAGYSSCGDLAHWLLDRLGCRDERVINRTDDAGQIPWRAGVNVSRLRWAPWYVSASEHGLPEIGDVIHVMTPGVIGSDHVAVLVEQTSRDQWVTADYGQPHGQLRVCQLRDVSRGLQVRGRLLMGWISLALVPLTDSAVVPDDFVGGVEDDNPYRPPDARA